MKSKSLLLLPSIILIFLLQSVIIAAFNHTPGVQSKFSRGSAPISTMSKRMLTNIEPQANSIYTNRQKRPVITSSGPNYLIAWTSNDQEQDKWVIRVRAFDSAGNPLSSDIETSIEGTDERPAATILTNGNAVVAARSSASTIQLQLLTLEGSLISTIHVSDGGEEINSEPDLCTLKNGNLLAVWTVQQGSQYAIKGQLFNPDLTINGSSQTIRSLPSTGSGRPRVCALEDGGFVVTWHQREPVIELQVYARIYEDTFLLRHSEILVPLTSDNNQMNPEVACLSNGNFVVAWQSDQTNQYQIYGKIYYPNGAMAKHGFQINSMNENWKSEPSVTRLNGGGFVVAWEQHVQEDVTHVFASTYDETGNRLIIDYRVHQLTSNINNNPDIAPLHGGFVVVWESIDQDKNGIFFNRFAYGLSQSCIQSGCPDPYVCNSNLDMCTICETDLDCPPITPVCNLVSLQCFSCTSDEDCVNAKGPYCNSTTGACQECKFTDNGSNSTCEAPNRPICDTTNFVCRGCQGSSDCSEVLPSCNWITGQCVQCIDNSDCIHNVSRPVCDAVTLTCRGCLKDSECPNKFSHCDTDGRCKECYEKSHCLLPQREYCNSNFSCVQCLENQHCTDPKKNYCDPKRKTCYGCYQDADCPDSTKCDIVKQECYEITVLSEAVQEAIQAVATAMTTAAATTTAPVLAVNPSLLWGFVKLLQSFYYFLFFNVEYPVNLKSFLSICRLGTFSFIPNLFASVEYDLPSPKNFYENEYNGFIYQTEGSNFSFWIYVFCIIGILTVLDRVGLSRSVPYIKKAKQLIIPQLGELWETTCIEIIYGSVLQIRQPRFVNFGTFTGWFLSILLIIFSFIYLYFMQAEIRKKPDSPFIFKKWLPLSDYLRRILQPYPMVFLYNYPFQQIAFVWTMNAMHLIVILGSGLKENIMDFAKETAYLLNHILISYFLYTDMTAATRVLVGWVVIALCISVIVIEISSLIFVAIKKIFLVVKLVKKLNSPKKIMRKTNLKQLESKYIEPKVIRNERTRRVKRINHIVSLTNDSSIDG